jgi:bifunctional DNA-binding transcriptional regulator/antitoxin component of YhaV-PrlF toxin-antitoxin module
VELTSVVMAQSKSRSLRTTIPVGIARQFGIDEKTQLGWEIEARDNELRIVVRPVKQPTGSSGGETRNARARITGRGQ